MYFWDHTQGAKWCPFHSLCKMSVQLLLFASPSVTLWIYCICCKSVLPSVQFTCHFYQGSLRKIACYFGGNISFIITVSSISLSGRTFLYICGEELPVNILMAFAMSTSVWFSSFKYRFWSPHPVVFFVVFLCSCFTWFWRGLLSWEEMKLSVGFLSKPEIQWEPLTLRGRSHVLGIAPSQAASHPHGSAAAGSTQQMFLSGENRLSILQESSGDKTDPSLSWGDWKSLVSMTRLWGYSLIRVFRASWRWFSLFWGKQGTLYGQVYLLLLSVIYVIYCSECLTRTDECS